MNWDHEIPFRFLKLNFYIRFTATSVTIPVEVEKDLDGVTSALLGDDGTLSPERYPTSQFHQFWTVLKRTLLFSRRDWVRIQRRILFSWKEINFFLFHSRR